MRVLPLRPIILRIFSRLLPELREKHRLLWLALLLAFAATAAAGNDAAPGIVCKRNIEMTPLCKVEVTLPRVLGSREVRRGGVVDGVMVTVYITARQRCATG